MSMSLILADFHEVFVRFAKQAVKSRIVLDSNIKKIGKSCHTSNPVNGAIGALYPEYGH